MKVLFISRPPAYGGEHFGDGLRLAGALAKRESTDEQLTGHAHRAALEGLADLGAVGQQDCHVLKDDLR